MNRLRIAVLVIWTIGLSALLAAGRYSLFIRGSLWPLLFGTVVMFVLFLITTVTTRRGPGRPATAAVWARSSLLLLPLAYMFPLMSASAASGLNSFALHKRSLGLETGPESNVGGADAAAPEFNAGLAATADQAISLGTVAQKFRRLTGKRVVTEGRVFRDESLPAGTVGLYRFVIVCCAADAIPVQVVLRSHDAAELPNDGWVRVEGTVGSANAADGAPVAVVDAQRVTTIPAPSDPYLSPAGY